MATLVAEPELLSPLAVIRAIYDRVAEGGDVSGYLDEGISVVQAPSLPFGGTWQDGFAQMARRIYQAWPDFQVEPQAFYADGDVVLVETLVQGNTACRSPLNQPMIERWRVIAGRAVECQPFYFDAAAAASSTNPVKLETDDG